PLAKVRRHDAHPQADVELVAVRAAVGQVELRHRARVHYALALPDGAAPRLRNQRVLPALALHDVGQKRAVGNTIEVVVAVVRLVDNAAVAGARERGARLAQPLQQRAIIAQIVL
nr:hypothetical protein [Tanacetum cinerariifolium]